MREATPQSLTDMLFEQAFVVCTTHPNKLTSYRMAGITTDQLSELFRRQPSFVIVLYTLPRGADLTPAASIKK